MEQRKEMMEFVASCSYFLVPTQHNIFDSDLFLSPAVQPYLVQLKKKKVWKKLQTASMITLSRQTMAEL